MRETKRRDLDTPRRAWVVDDLTLGKRYPVLLDRFRVGGDVEDDITVRGMGPHAVALMFHANGEVWLGEEDDSHELGAEVPVHVGGRLLIVRIVVEPGAADIVEMSYPYAVITERHGDGEASALIEDLARGARYRFAGGPGAALLHLLASSRLVDQEAGIDPGDVGWRSHKDIAKALWGIRAEDAPPSRVDQVVAGLRGALRRVGFDPWFLEKRRGAVRVRALEVEAVTILGFEDAPTDPGVVRDTPFQYGQSADVWGDDDEPTQPVAADPDPAGR